MAPTSGAHQSSTVQPTMISRTDVLVLPRYFLMLALKEHLADLGRNADREKLPDFWADLKTRLLRLSEVVKGIRGQSDSEDGLRRANDVVDTELVEFLQSVPGVPDILHSYLPRKGQTWDEFLQEKPEHERKLAVAELDITLLQENLPNLIVMYMDQFLKEVDVMIQAPGRQVMTTSASRTWSISVSKSMPSDPSHVKRRGSELVRVFYATDRILSGDEYVSAVSELNTPRSLPEYSGESTLGVRDKVVEDSSPARPLKYGYADISIPVNHRPGAVDRPLFNELENEYDHMIIKDIHKWGHHEGDGFFESLSRDIVTAQSNNLDHGELLVFIHGYNVKHEGALMVAAQLKVDMKFGGTVVAYTWSSCGTLLGYLADEYSVLQTVQPLKDFLLSLVAKIPMPTKIHLLAHSMGSRALIKALHLLHSGPAPPRNLNLSTVTFAAADDRPVFFEQMLQTVKKAYALKSTDSATPNGVGSRLPLFSVYCSQDDVALELSRGLHSVTNLGEHRLGDTDSLFDWRWLHSTKLNLDDHDVIDATGTDSSIFSIHHSYFSQVPAVLQDIRVVLSKSTPAKGRSSVFNVGSHGIKFFAFCNQKWNPTSKL